MVKIKNIELKTLYGMLADVPLKGKQSRHRIKFIDAIDKRFSEFAEDQNKLIIEAAQKDENGEPIIAEENENGTRSYKLDESKREFLQEELDLLDKEEVDVEVRDEQVLYDILDDLDKELSGMEAIAHNNLMDALEESLDK